MRVLLVDPVSSGAFLAAAFAEAGVSTVHLYGADLAHAAAADPAEHVLVLDEDDDRTRLEELGITEVVAASEFGVTRASEIAEALGIPHHDPALRLARRNKPAMQRALLDAGVPALRTYEVNSLSEAERLAAQLPAHQITMIKPSNNAGSEGCATARQPGEIVPLVAQVLGRHNLLGAINDSALVQEYADGPQFIVNTVSSGGRHYLSEIYSETIDESAGVPLLRHITNLSRLDEQAREVIGHTFRCLDALGIRNGAGHSELRSTSHGPRLIEVNSRVMGPRLDPDPYLCAFGYSQQHLVVQQVCAPAAFEERMQRPYAPRATLAKVFLRSFTEGVLHASPGLEVLRRLPGFHSAVSLPAAGRPLEDLTLTTAKTGVAFFVHEDAALVASSVRAVHDLEDAGQLYRVRPCAS